MELNLRGSAEEIESLLIKIANLTFGKESPPIVTINPEVIPEVTPVESEIFKRDPTPVEVEVVDTVNGKKYYKFNATKHVDIFIDGVLYKKFVSQAAASAYFGKSNLGENIKHGFRFSHNGIWFTISYSK